MTFKNSLVCLLGLFCCVSLSAQSGKVKNIKWTEQVLGTWQIDSMVDVSDKDNPRTTQGNEETSKLNLLPGQKIILSDQGKYIVAKYDLLQGTKHRILYLGGTLLRIDTINAKSMVCTMSPGDLDGERMKVYFTRGEFPMDQFKKNLAGTYHSQMEEEPYWMPDGSTMPGGVNAAPYFMELDTNGSSSWYNGNTKDSGTWSLNPYTLTIELKGKSTLKYNIVEMQRETIKLHKSGTRADSFINLYLASIDQMEEMGIEPTEEIDMPAQVDEMNPVADSMRRADSTLAAEKVKIEQELMQQQLEEEYRSSIYKKWQAESSDNKKTGIEFRADGTVIYTDGKKEHKGTWKKGSMYNELILNFKGKEQLATFSLPEQNYYAPSPITRLTVTMIPPGKKTVETITYTPQP